LRAVAPPLFRYAAARFAGHAQTGSAVAGATAAATVRVGAAGLDLTFLVMLVPLGGAGLLLLLRTHPHLCT
jgi:hypothetical protein